MACDKLSDAQITAALKSMSSCMAADATLQSQGTASAANAKAAPPACQKFYERVPTYLDGSHGSTLLAAVYYTFGDRTFGKGAALSSHYTKGEFLVKPKKKVEGQFGVDSTEIGDGKLLVPLYTTVLLPQYESGSLAVVPMFYEQHMNNNVMNMALLSDLSLIGLALVAIFGVVWLNTGSLFVTTLGMVQVICAFPTAVWIYDVVLQIKWSPFLNLLGMFVILGIGADDLFVFSDAWKQSLVVLPTGTPLANRIAYCYHRAGVAMAITSFTTAAAFLSKVVNKFQPIRLFSIFMAIMCMVDLCFVLSVFPVVITVHHLHFKEKRSLTAWLGR